MYGKMPASRTRTTRRAADRPLGRQPVDLGHPSRPVRARGAEERRAARRDRSARERRSRGRPICIWPSGPAPMWRSRSRCIASCSRTVTPMRVSRRAHNRRATAARARRRVDVRARRGASPARRRRSRRLAELYARTSPAVIRCGWGLERNRNGGNAAMAILALPAVAGKFGVRGGGYSMSNSAAWNITASVDRAPRTARRASST